MTAQPDSNKAIEFLRTWNPDGPWVLTSIQPDQKGIETKTFGPASIVKLREWLDQYNGVRNIYFSVNTPSRNLSKKAEKEDIKQAEWLHIDLDPRAGENVKEEQERIQRVLNNPPKGVPLPTLIIASGGGCQGFWKLDEPYEVHGDYSKITEFERYTRQLAITFDADNCHNIDRIMRVPGTVNLPNAKKKKQGRVPATAELLEYHPDRVYPLSSFIPAAEVQNPVVNGLSQSSHQIKIPGNIEFLESIHDLDQWGVNDRTKQLIVQGNLRHEEGPKEKDDSRSAWLFDAVCSLLRSSVPDEVIFVVLMDPSHGISESILDKGVNAQKYAIKQINDGKDFAIEPKLKELNQKHAVISNMAGKCRVIEEVYDPVMKRTKITKQSFEDFRNRYMNQQVVVFSDDKGDVKKPMGQWWLQHANRRQYESIVFAPNNDMTDAYNLWRGFAVSARPGNCDLFLEHVKTNICQGNEEYYNYLVGWMARAVQHPDGPGQTAIILRGRQGTGKSMFAKTFGSLFGRHFLQVSDPKHLVGSFNAHLRDCVVLFADEAFYAGDKKHESILKTLVTEETLVVEGKGVDAEAASNFTHIIMASNSHWVVPAGADERRYFVLDVGFDQMQNTKYFNAINKELNEGGREALLHFLMTYDLSEYDIRQVPKTAALHEQRLLSLSPEEEWWYSKLIDGRLLLEHDQWNNAVMKDKILEDYVEYMKKIGIQRRATSTALGKFLNRVCPGIFPRSYQKMTDVTIPLEGGFHKKVKRRVYFNEFPSLSDCRNHWDENFGGQNEWPPEQETMAFAQEEPDPVDHDVF